MRIKHKKWEIALAFTLVFFSVILYLLHYFIFRDTHHIYIYLLGDVAFLPLEVLLVTLIIHSLLRKRERCVMIEKLGMVIGVFFSTIGTRLLAYLSDLDPELGKIKKKLIIKEQWGNREFLSLYSFLKRHVYSLDGGKIDLPYLRELLKGKMDFMTRLLENPVLLEHEPFTELLRAVFHLAEELDLRGEITGLPDKDREHLAGDVRRVYGLLVYRWAEHMKYLKNNYPYLFSLAMRTNPFDDKAAVTIG